MTQAAASPEAHVVRVERSWDETPAFRGLALSAPPAVLEVHRAPGQYLRLGTSAELEGTFALSRAPGSGTFELLVKRGARFADTLVVAAPGAELYASLPMGQGFPLADHGGRDVLLFAAGSGIAPIRSVIQAIDRQRAAFGAVHLFYGQRHPEDFAYRGEHEAWGARGIAVTLCASQPPTEGWPGARGRVQDALITQPPPLDNAVVYLAGMKPMLEAVTTILVELGLPRERVFLNY